MLPPLSLSEPLLASSFLASFSHHAYCISAIIPISPPLSASKNHNYQTLSAYQPIMLIWQQDLSCVYVYQPSDLFSRLLSLSACSIKSPLLQEESPVARGCPSDPAFFVKRCSDQCLRDCRGRCPSPNNCLNCLQFSAPKNCSNPMQVIS